MSFLDKLLTGLGITLKNAHSALPTPVTTIDIENGDASYDSLSGEHTIDLIGARVPTAHASTHITGGSDIIPNAVASGNAGLISGASQAKLDGLVASQWYSTSPAVGWRSPTKIQSSRGIDLVWDSGSSSIIVQTNFDVPAGPTANWYATGPTPGYQFPVHVQSSRGISLIWDSGSSSIIIETNFDPTTIQNNPSLITSGPDKVWEIRQIFAVLPINATPVDVGPILGSDYSEAGSVGGGLSFHLMTVDFEVCGDDGSNNTFYRFYRALLHKLVGSWDIVQNLTELTGLAAGTITGGFTPTITRAGTDDGDIGVTFTFTGAASPKATWCTSIRIFGGGRYA